MSHTNKLRLPRDTATSKGRHVKKRQRSLTKVRVHTAWKRSEFLGWQRKRESSNCGKKIPSGAWKKRAATVEDLNFQYCEPKKEAHFGGKPLIRRWSESGGEVVRKAFGSKSRGRRGRRRKAPAPRKELERGTQVIAPMKSTRREVPGTEGIPENNNLYSPSEKPGSEERK